MFADLKMLEQALKTDPKPSSNWRTTPENYQPVEAGLKAGTMSISPAWFEQAHEVFCPLQSLHLSDLYSSPRATS